MSTQTATLRLAKDVSGTEGHRDKKVMRMETLAYAEAAWPRSSHSAPWEEPPANFKRAFTDRITRVVDQRRGICASCVLLSAHWDTFMLLVPSASTQSTLLASLVWPNPSSDPPTTLTRLA